MTEPSRTSLRKPNVPCAAWLSKSGWLPAAISCEVIEPGMIKPDSSNFMPMGKRHFPVVLAVPTPVNCVTLAFICTGWKPILSHFIWVFCLQTSECVFELHPSSMTAQMPSSVKGSTTLSVTLHLSLCNIKAHFSLAATIAVRDP